MKEEKFNNNKIEYIQMSNILMKKELKFKLLEESDLNVHFHNRKQKYKNYINNFLEDLFNIMNQQMLLYSQIYESTEESEIENLIVNEKFITFNMIINFFNKIFSLIIEETGNNLFRNYSSSKFSGNKIRKQNEINKIFEDNFFMNKNNKKNSNSYNKNKYIRNNNINNIKSYKINSYNRYHSKNIFDIKNNNINNRINNLKSYSINLNELKENDGKEIEIYIKPNNIKKQDISTGSMGKCKSIKIEKKSINQNDNCNNHIIFIKQIYKGLNSNSIKNYKDYINIDKRKKNKLNQINIKNNENKLKNIKKIQKEKDINYNNNKINNNKSINYKPFKPRNQKNSTKKINININNNNNIKKDYLNFTQKIEKNKYNYEFLIDNIINKAQGAFSGKKYYNINNSDILKTNDNLLSVSENSKLYDKMFNKTEVIENNNNKNISFSTFSIDTNNQRINTEKEINEKEVISK